MREIKFRCWISSAQEMVGWDEMEKHGDIYRLIKQPNAYPLMQYTGLKDKNGVEIYEGDIVMILYTDWPSMNGESKLTLGEYLDSISNVAKVIFKDCEFCVQFNSDGYADSIHCGPHGRIKVIGNIYENPDLIGDI